MVKITVDGVKRRVLQYVAGGKIRVLSTTSLEEMRDEALELRQRAKTWEDACEVLKDTVARQNVDLTKLADALSIEKSEHASLYRELFRLRNSEFTPDISGATQNYSINSANKERKVIVIGITTVSQIPLLRALCESVPINENYVPIVVAFIDIKDELVLYCAKSEILLYDSNYNIVLGRSNTVSGGGDCDIGPINIHYNIEAPSSADRYVTDLFNEIRRLSFASAACEQFLNYFDVSLVVVFEDNPEYASKTLVGRARARNIPIVVVPFTIADEIEVAEAYFDNENYRADHSFFNRFVARVWPKWTLNYRARTLLRSRGLYALADEALCAAPAEPWKSGSTRASFIAAESEAMISWYLANGAQKNQVVFTGSIIDDVIVDSVSRQKEIRALLEIDSNVPVLLCSFPPNQLDGANRATEWSSFDELIEFWGGQLVKIQGWHVIIKPHPSLADVYIEKIRSMGLRVSNLDTAQLLPVCTLYNACVSSTIRWALALGKPVLNFDAFSFNYREFTLEAGVLTVSSREALEAALVRLTGDAGCLQTQVEAAQAGAPRWGQLDGRAGERLCSLFDCATRGQIGRPFAQHEAMAEED